MRKLSLRVFLGLVLASLAASGVTYAQSAEPASKPDSKADSKMIGDTLKEYIVAWKAGDAQRIAKLYGSDAIILPGDHVAESTHAGIVKYNQDFFDEYKPGSFTITTQDRKIIGDWAFDSGSYTFTATAKAGGKPLSDRGKYIVIMHRQGGVWKWYRDIDNSDGPEAPAAPGKS